MWGCTHSLGSARPRRYHCNGTHSGTTVSMAMCPSGVKLMVVTDDVILSFMLRNTGQLETAAMMCHIPANCSKPSLPGFGEDLGSYHPPGGPIPTMGPVSQWWKTCHPKVATCHPPLGPATHLGDL